MGSGSELGRGGQTRVLLSARPRLAWMALDSHSVLTPDVLICRAGITLPPASRGSREAERDAPAERLARAVSRAGLSNWLMTGPLGAYLLI